LSLLRLLRVLDNCLMLLELLLSLLRVHSCSHGTLSTCIVSDCRARPLEVSLLGVDAFSMCLRHLFLELLLCLICLESILFGLISYNILFLGFKVSDALKTLVGWVGLVQI